MSDILRRHGLAIAVALSTATQLRLPAMPVGIGELAMGLCIAWRWLHAPRIVDDLDGVLRTIRLAGCALIGSAVLAWLLAEPVHVADAAGGLILPARIVAALAFSAIFAEAAMALAPRPESRLRLCVAIVHWTGVFCALILVAAFAGPGFVQGHLWYENGARLRGLSENPNQLGLQVAFAILLLGLALTSTVRTATRLSLIAAGAACAAAGLLSRSDAMVIAVLGGLATGACLSLRRLREWRPIISRLGISLPGIAVAAGTAGWLLLSRPLLEASRAMFEEGNQGRDRIALWDSAWRFFAQNPITGGGPAPHAKLDRIPDAMEAHNLFLDWASMTGTIGLATLLAVLGAALMVGARRGNEFQTALLVGLLFFSLFHFTLRQPVLWLAICITMSALPSAPPRARSRECAA